METILITTYTHYVNLKFLNSSPGDGIALWDSPAGADGQGFVLVSGFRQGEGRAGSLYPTCFKDGGHLKYPPRPYFMMHSALNPEP